MRYKGKQESHHSPLDQNNSELEPQLDSTGSSNGWKGIASDPPSTQVVVL